MAHTATGTRETGSITTELTVRSMAELNCIHQASHV